MTSTKKSQPKQPEQIAIVGLGGLFPGSVDVAAFWNNILRGTDLVTDIPDSHWSVEDYFAEDAMKRPASAVDKTYARRGAFLPKVPFETLKEGIPPSLLPSTDTAQLLSLMVARVALEECFGGPVDQADRSRVSCILGVTSGQELFGQMASRLAWPQWIAGMRAAGIDDVAAKKAADEIAKCFTPWSEASFPGLLGNVVAGRIANRLDLGGSNAVTDAACASSFAAVSMGVDELLLGRADVVLTGGVDTLNDIFMYMCFTKTPALSASGECRPFDAKADGTLLGEGLGMLALKRLSDAERDGNTIYALISGIGTSSDGRSKSVYAPVSEGQAKALVRAYESAGYPATTVELVEAHGTGTKAGDVAELGGLRLAFDDARWAKTQRQFCAIGSVKSQIGHTKSAAGAAGLIKAALALHEKVLPPTIKVDTPNPQADFVTSPFYVNAGLRPWFRGSDHPRRAGVSSFGFGGSNWHITLSEYQGGKHGASLGRREVEVLALSATTKAALQERAAGMVSAIGDVTDLCEFCARENAFFDAGAHARVSFVASSIDELSKRLQQVARGEASPTIFWGEGQHNGATAFIFPGQGSQVVEMGKAMALAFDDARAVWDRGCDVLPDVVRTAYPPTAFDDATRAAQQQALTQTENAQPALGLSSIAAVRVLQRLGVPMDMAAGHSFGELSALCAAGVFDEAALLRLARRRGELMKAASTTSGAMAAVVGDTSGLAALLAPFVGRVVLANDNAPDQAVISGEKAAVDEAIAAIEKTGLRVKKLPVSTAFHSPLVAAACEPLLESLRGTAMQAPSVPVFANTTAAAHSDDVDVIRQALSEQVRAPVRFVEEIRAMAKAGATVFIEVGSGTVLTGLVSRIVPDATAIAFDPNKGLSGICAALARLCAAGVPVDLGALPAQRPLPKPVAPSKTAVMISGANVGRPPRPAPAPVTISTRAVAPAMTASPPVTAVVHASSPLPVAAPVSAMTSRSAPPPAPQAVAGTGQTGQTGQTVPHGAISAPDQTVPHGAISSPSAGWLQVFSEGQQQTMDAHLAFQKALSDAHTAYLGAFESTSNALVQALSGRAALPIAPAVALPAVAAPVAAPIAAPVRAAPVAAPMVTAPVVTAPKAVAPKAAVVVAPVVVAPVVVAPVVAGPAVDARAALYAVVADKTGYPTSALDDSMHLESDLGIDSIKRVEILGALKDKVPAAKSLDALKLAQLATLGEIAAALATVTGPVVGVAIPLPAATSSTASRADAVDTCPRAVVRLAPAARGTPDLPPGPIAIVEGGPRGAALAVGVATSASIRGVDVIVTTAAAMPAVMGTLIDLSALDAHGDGVTALTDGLFLLQAAGAALKASSGRALVVANGGGCFAPADGVAAFGLSGLTKTARQEWPGVDVRFVDVDLRDPLAAELVASQCFVSTDVVEVGLNSRQLLTPTVLDAPIVADAPSLLASGDVVVITGGARGVTATCALALAKAVPGLKLALLQRTVVDAPEPLFAHAAVDEGGLKRAILADAAARGASVPLREVAGMAQQILAAREVRATLQTLRQSADVDLFACDVQQADSVEAALAAVRRRFGDITVVVHGAGVLADKRIEDKTRDQVKGVVGTKVAGLLAILQHTAHDPLKAVVAFSSVAGRFGNVGQVDYAMANEAMTRILTGVKAKRPQLVVKSLHWGPWEGGMVTPELKAAFASRGVTVIARDDGARAFVAELSTAASDDVEVVLGASLASARPGLDGPGGVKKSSSRIDASSMPFLADHAVKGEVVLPVVVAMDLMLSAAVDAGLGAVHAISDVEVLRGQRLPRYLTEGHVGEATVSVEPNGRLRLELRIDGVLGYRALATVGSAVADAVVTVTVPVVQKAAFALPLYTGSDGPGLLFHGPRFQLIDALDGVNEHAMTARVLSTAAAGFAGRFSSDVAALDAGLQLVLLWARHRTGGAFLPTRVGALTLHQGALPEGLLTCVVEAKASLGSADIRAVADVHFIDSRGVQVCSMTDVVAHRLPDDDAFGSLGPSDIVITAPGGAAE